MLLILGIFALRYLLRSFLGGEASVLHVTAADLTDAFMVLAVGVVCSQRVEWFLRARQMIAQAKAASPLCPPRLTHLDCRACLLRRIVTSCSPTKPLRRSAQASQRAATHG